MLMGFCQDAHHRNRFLDVTVVACRVEGPSSRPRHERVHQLPHIRHALVNDPARKPDPPAAAPDHTDGAPKLDDG
eukprot:15147937-Alexandrium_andersonii.AAC.1